MKLFTKSDQKKLQKQYPLGSNLEQQKVIVKIFNPYGRGVWYILNQDPDDPDYLWAIVDLFEVEMGSVSKSELESIEVPPFGLPLERDMYFEPINAKILWDGLMSGKKYETGGETGSEKRVDLFEHSEQQPPELRAIVEKWEDRYADEEMDYEDTRQFLKEVESVGYTFDFYLDNMPVGLRPKGVELEELKGYEMAKGGQVFERYFMEGKYADGSDYFEAFDSEEEMRERYKEWVDKDILGELDITSVTMFGEKGSGETVAMPKKNGQMAKGGEASKIYYEAPDETTHIPLIYYYWEYPTQKIFDDDGIYLADYQPVKYKGKKYIVTPMPDVIKEELKSGSEEVNWDMAFDANQEDEQFFKDYAARLGLILKKGGKVKVKNPFAICTAAIGESTGTTKRSEWGEATMRKYERCVLDVKKEKKKRGGEVPLAPTEMEVFDKIIKGSKSVEEAFKKAKTIRDVPVHVADYFYKNFGNLGKATPYEAFRKYYDQVMNIKTPKPISKSAGGSIPSRPLSGTYTNKQGDTAQVKALRSGKYIIDLQKKDSESMDSFLDMRPEMAKRFLEEGEFEPILKTMAKGGQVGSFDSFYAKHGSITSGSLFPL